MNWSALRPGCFKADKDPYVHGIEDWVGPGGGSDDLENRKISFSCKVSKFVSSSPYSIHHTVYTASAAISDYSCGKKNVITNIQQQCCKTLKSRMTPEALKTGS